jgi:hypothetical protein
MVCKHCGFKLQGYTHHSGYRRTDGSGSVTFDYTCGGYRTKGTSVCRRYWLRRDPFETLILERVEKRLKKYLARGGEATLRKFIAEELIAKTPDPREDVAKVKADLASLQAEADRLLDIATPASRDFVDERLGKIRGRRQDLEARLADLQRVDYQPVDLEAATREALAYLARFREVLEEGTLEQRKEFLRGFVAEISIDPDAARGTITFYELPAGSLMMVPGVGVEPTRAGGPRDFKAAGKGQRIKDSANSLPFSRPRSPRRVVESEDYGHPDGHVSGGIGGRRRSALHPAGARRAAGMLPILPTGARPLNRAASHSPDPQGPREDSHLGAACGKLSPFRGCSSTPLRRPNEEAGPTGRSAPPTDYGRPEDFRWEADYSRTSAGCGTCPRHARRWRPP